VFFQALNTPKLVFGRSSARTPLGELTTLPQGPNPLVGFSSPSTPLASRFSTPSITRISKFGQGPHFSECARASKVLIRHWTLRVFVRHVGKSTLEIVKIEHECESL